MAEVVTVRGKVVGEAGKAVAGWVSLGKKQPQRWLSHVVRIADEAGREITVEGLSHDSIVPVRKREVAWREIEGDPLAQLCEREAPAPDVEVDFTTAVLRGGDDVAVWGDALDYGPVQSPAGDFRTAPERGLTKLSARAIAVGDDRDELLDAMKKRREQSERDKAAAAAKKHEAKAPVVPKKPAVDPDYTSQLGWNWPLAVTVLGLVLAGLLGYVTGYHGPFLAAAAALCYLPVAFDAQFLPPLRDRGVAPASPDAPFVVYLLAGGVAVMAAGGFMKGDFDGAQARRGEIGGLVFAGIATACMGWMWLVTRRRQRYVALMAKAPPHPRPMRDGVWGATDGRFSSEVMAVGEDIEVWGTATANSAGIKSRNVSSKAFKNLALQGQLMTDDDESIAVQTSDAAIVTLTKFNKSTGKDRARAAEVINASTPVRVVGRAREGVIRKGGEASLLVFAAGPGGNVDVELRRMHRRLLAAHVLVMVGVACYVAAFFA